MFCLLVVLVKLSLLAKWLARKTPLRKPNCGEGIISRKPRPKSAHDFLGLLYCFIVLLCIYIVSCPYVTYFPTLMAQYSLFVLKVPLNPKQTNKQTLACEYNNFPQDHCISPFLSPTPTVLHVLCTCCRCNFCFHQEDYVFVGICLCGLCTHTHTHTHTLRFKFNGHFSRWTWVSRLPP